VRVAHAEAIATWTVELDHTSRTGVANSITYGTARFGASDLIEYALNGRTRTAYDERENGSRVVNQQETITAREKQQQIKDRFREWVWEDPERAARFARDYNDRFNNLRLRTSLSSGAANSSNFILTPGSSLRAGTISPRATASGPWPALPAAPRTP